MLKLSIKHEGVTVPPPSAVANAGVEIWRDTTGAVYAYGERHGDECWMHVPGVASYYFTPEGGEVAASIVEGAQKDLVLDAYRRRVLPMAVQVSGAEVLHASAVRSPAGIIGLCGVSQTGKSTIAFGLSQRGFSIWCDDALAFQVSEQKPLAISLPFQLRLRPTARKLFGDEIITPETSNLPGSHRAPLAAICVLRRDDVGPAPANFTRLGFSEAFLRLLDPACWFKLENSFQKRQLIERYIDLAATIPVFDVSFKSGLEHLPAVLDAIEEACDPACAVQANSSF